MTALVEFHEAEAQRLPSEKQRKGNSMSEQHEFARMDAEYRERVSAIRKDGDLNDEARARQTKALGDAYDRNRREAEQAAADRLENEEKENYRKAFGPKRSTLTAAQETARELRLARVRAEVAEELSSGMQDPLRAYEHALRAGDTERAEIIGKVGARHLEDPTRRRRLAELVAEHEPEERKRAKKRLADVDERKRSLDIGAALHHRVRGAQGLSFAELAEGGK